MILVTGASGLIGRHLVMRLLAEHQPVRCLVKDERQPLPWLSPDRPLDAPLPETITGSLLDEELLFRAVTDVHTIIHLESAQWWGRLRELERVELVGTRNLLNVARAARVGRIITVSQLGASPSSAYILLRIKGQLEELITASGLAYTILRSGVVFGPEDTFINHMAMMLALNPFFTLIPGQGEIVLHPIYIDDLIAAIVRSLGSIDSVDRVIEIGGPEYITFADLTRTVMRVTRQRRLMLSVPPYVLRWTTAVYSRLFPRPLLTQQWLDILAANRTARIGSIYEHFGLHPRRIEDTLLTYMPRRRYWWAGLRYPLRRRPRGI
jgi:NADH dehydrogenase